MTAAAMPGEAVPIAEIAEQKSTATGSLSVQPGDATLAKTCRRAGLPSSGCRPAGTSSDGCSTSIFRQSILIDRAGLDAPDSRGVGPTAGQ